MDRESLSWRREITTISFDVDGTLLDFDAAMRAALNWVLDEIRRVVPAVPNWLTVTAMIAIREALAEAHPQERHETIRRMGMARALELIGHPDPGLASDLAEGYLVRRFAATHLFPDTADALQALGRRFRLGVISNGNSDPGRYGLGHHFSFLVFSEDHGVAKPDPRLFAIALRQAGCRPHECLHVGDLPTIDIAGARAAGLRSAWLCGEGDVAAASPTPDVTIRCLTDLADLFLGEA